ncbi:MAG: aminoacyl-tRNA hydrolase [Bacteroidales bacterium]|nr:aminoacyl-tRNA hydrolase [Bacteroidales bacterium]
MNPEELKERIPVSELILSASRSGGPGGQNVNKVSTKVELRFNVLKSSFISDREKEKIMAVLKRRVNTEGELIIVSQTERTQYMNRKKVVEKFYLLVSAALTEQPERRATSPTKASKSERIEKKKKRGIIKKLRKDSGISDEEL